MRTVLIVEDENKLLHVLADIFRDRGFKILLARDGAEAWKVFQAHSPAAVLTDLTMSRADGIAFTRLVRSHPIYNRIPIIALTARNTQADRYEAYSAGVDEYLTKPFEPEELVMRVAGLMRLGNTSNPRQTSVEASAPDLTPLLTHTETALVSFLEARLNEPVPVEVLLSEALGYAPGAGSPELIRAHIRNIRQKVEADPTHPSILRTVTGVGYVLTSPLTGSG